MTDDSDDEQRRHCPRCGEPIQSVSISGPDGAELYPCGHVIPPDHPVLSDTENENKNDNNS
ncbi:hypothetical protein [Haladaptatus salinisoli]|uniref:hypothetical protein n=1 Tax=Haladaptatus salinisoli TaxID=2884876 RepID=UPI001D0B61E8|nr:hypothetical protein [Haladaptatus salinisoli]